MPAEHQKIRAYSKYRFHTKLCQNLEATAPGSPDPVRVLYASGQASVIDSLFVVALIAYVFYREKNHNCGKSANFDKLSIKLDHTPYTHILVIK